jgi:hypothetical protein
MFTVQLSFVIGGCAFGAAFQEISQGARSATANDKRQLNSEH